MSTLLGRSSTAKIRIIAALQQRPTACIKDIARDVRLTRVYIWKLARKDPDVGAAYEAFLAARLESALAAYRKAVDEGAGSTERNRKLYEVLRQLRNIRQRQEYTGRPIPEAVIPCQHAQEHLARWLNRDTVVPAPEVRGQ